MAAIASQVILHPHVAHCLKVASSTAGRDKAYRAVQFFCRFIVWYLLRSGDKSSTVRWNALKLHLATARKLLRLGKPVEHLQAALRSNLSAGPAFERITTVAKQLSYCGFLALDAIIWANTIQLISLSHEASRKVFKTSNRLWLSGILFSISHGLIKTVRLSKEAKTLLAPWLWDSKEISNETECQSKLLVVEKAQKLTQKQIIIDTLDLWLPATALEIVSLNEGLVAIFGLVTSLMGLQLQWQVAHTK